MPRLSPAQFDVRRKQILDATFRCLANKGYARMTVRDIAREAGISVGTLYLYFEDKHAMVRALREQSQQLEAERVRPQLAAAGPVERLEALLECLLRDLDAPGSDEMLRVDIQLWAESLHQPALKDLIQEVFDDKIGQFAELVRAAQVDGNLAEEVDPEALARIFLALVAGLELQRALQPDYAYVALLGALKAMLPRPA